MSLSLTLPPSLQEAAPRGKQAVAEENFSAFCLPGMLPGLYMGYNYHGLVYTVNTVSTKGGATAGVTRELVGQGRWRDFPSGLQLRYNQ